MAAPDLQTSEGRTAYRAELMRVARGWRWAGLALVTLAAVGMIEVSRMDLGWGSELGRLTLAALIIGWGLVIIGIFKRTRHHKARMAGGDA